MKEQNLRLMQCRCTLDYKFFRAIVGLLICARAFHPIKCAPPQIPEIHFPLRNIENSIDWQFSSKSESNFSSEFRRYTSGNGFYVNLPKLNHEWAPNPYPGFIQSEKVTAISLRENGIYQVSPGSFDAVPNVQFLDLSRNRLALCDLFNYGSCVENLETLVIEDNQLPGDSLDRDVSKPGCFPRVESLYLRRDRIRRLNFPLRESFPRLVSLYLSDNEIDSCLFIREVPPSLAHLYVERNRISSIGSSILKSLRSLRADSNSIRSICSSHCGESSLQLRGTDQLLELSLADNRVSQIEACAFRDSSSLSSLNLSSNSLESIHASTFVALRALRRLHLDHNQLSCLPNLRGNWHLETLSASNNRLSELRREQFSSLTSLRTLLLAGNKIFTVQCNTFADLASLERLDLSGNRIETLPSGWMNGLSNLKHLDLSGNRFTYVHQLSLRTSASIRLLYLRDNKFTRSDEAEIQAYCPFAQVFLDSCTYSCSSHTTL